jgi:hypothetical protein
VLFIRDIFLKYFSKIFQKIFFPYRVLGRLCGDCGDLAKISHSSAGFGGPTWVGTQWRQWGYTKEVYILHEKHKIKQPAAPAGAVYPFLPVFC